MALFSWVPNNEVKEISEFVYFGSKITADGE